MIIMDTLSNNSIQLKELDKKDLFRKKKYYWIYSMVGNCIGKH